MKRTLVVLVVILIAVVGFFAFNAYIYSEKQAPNPQVSEPYRGTLTGTYVCLPHKDTTGPQTEECAYGLRTESGEHYAIDFSLLSQEMKNFQAGNQLKATGLITPIENLSTDQWQRYDVVGIFSVTDSVEKL